MFFATDMMLLLNLWRCIFYISIAPETMGGPAGPHLPVFVGKSSLWLECNDVCLQFEYYLIYSFLIILILGFPFLLSQITKATFGTLEFGPFEPGDKLQFCNYLGGRRHINRLNWVAVSTSPTAFSIPLLLVVHYVICINATPPSPFS